jgi:hypothetical protein
MLEGEPVRWLPLQEFLVGVQTAILAGVVKRYVSVRSFVPIIDFAHVKRLGINVDADGALIVFGQIQNLVDGFEGVHVGGMHGVHFVDIGGSEMARTAVLVSRVAILDAKILDLEAADRGGHPAVLVTMIVDAAELADFPADRHAFEDVVLEDQVARVTALREEEILIERFRTNGVAEDVVLNIFESEVTLVNGGEVFDPVTDGQLRDGELFRHKERLRF